MDGGSTLTTRSADARIDDPLQPLARTASYALAMTDPAPGCDIFTPGFYRRHGASEHVSRLIRAVEINSRRESMPGQSTSALRTAQLHDRGPRPSGTTESDRDRRPPLERRTDQPDGDLYGRLRRVAVNERECKVWRRRRGLPAASGIVDVHSGSKDAAC